jgi:GcrA cell cycle regulator
MPKWSDENIAMALRLWMEGYSARRIAAQLPMNVTRSAVIGLIHRHSMKQPTGPKIRRTQKARVARRPKDFTPKPAAPRPDIPAVPHVPPPPHETDIARVSMELAIDGKHCRWPIGEFVRIDKLFYCGCEVVPGLSYCSAHAQRAYTAPQPISRVLIPVRLRRHGSYTKRQFEFA